jgi:peptidase E
MQPHKLLLASEFNVVLDNPVAQQLLADRKKLVFISTASKFERYSTYAPTQGIDKMAALGIETTPLELSATPPQFGL